jgi:hypothetical protein
VGDVLGVIRQRRGVNASWVAITASMLSMSWRCWLNAVHEAGRDGVGAHAEWSEFDRGGQGESDESGLELA